VPIGPTNFKPYQAGAGINMGLSEKMVISGIIFRQAQDLFQSINQTSPNRAFTHGSPGFPHRPYHHTNLSSKQR